MFGKRLRRARKRAGLTQEELAHRAGCDQTLISFYETGRHAPRLETFAALCQVLGVSADHLLGLEAA
jgi:transcriptional regulator with XRE-family HTH domain